MTFLRVLRGGVLGATPMSGEVQRWYVVDMGGLSRVSM